MRVVRSFLLKASAGVAAKNGRMWKDPPHKNDGNPVLPEIREFLWEKPVKGDGC